jgi:4-hydroxy-tetrahydrodipicolinate synthase
VPVVIGCTTFTATSTIELGRHARDIGADGILSTPPPYVSPTPREIERFYATISDGVDLPLMVYNWERGTGVEIEAGLAESLAKLDTVVAIKDSTANVAQAIETLERVVDRVRIFGGFVSRAGLALLQEIGGDGSIDGGGLGAPFAVRFYESFWRDDLDAARDAARAYRGLMSQLIRPDWSGVFASPQPQIKAAMNLLGQPGGFPRPPLLPLEDPASLAQLQHILERAGLVREAVALARG